MKLTLPRPRSFLAGDLHMVHPPIVLGNHWTSLHRSGEVVLQSSSAEVPTSANNFSRPAIMLGRNVVLNVSIIGNLPYLLMHMILTWPIMSQRRSSLILVSWNGFLFQADVISFPLCACFAKLTSHRASEVCHPNSVPAFPSVIWNVV